MKRLFCIWIIMLVTTPGFSQWRGVVKVLTSKTGAAVMTVEATKAYNRQSNLNEIARRNLQRTAQFSQFQIERTKTGEGKSAIKLSAIASHAISKNKKHELLEGLPIDSSKIFIPDNMKSMKHSSCRTDSIGSRDSMEVTLTFDGKTFRDSLYERHIISCQ